MIQSFASEAPHPSDLRQVLEQRYQGRNLHPYRSGQPIKMVAHEIWVVYRGVVLLSTLYPTGDEALLGLVSGSMPFGLPFTYINPYQAIALTDVDLMAVSLTEIEQSPLLAQEMFRHLSRRLQQSEAFLALSGCRRVEDRLRQLLILLQHEVGQPVKAGMRLNVRLTHQHLANAIGTTRVTITRLLGQLREEGWLTIDSTRHIVLPFGISA